MRTVHLQHGLSLIELMIAMALSLLLMLGVLQIFLSSKQTYSVNSALSRVQESGRFAIDFITYDLRNAGYKGECFSDVDGSSSDDRLNINQALKGWEAQTNLPDWPANLGTDKTPGTDSILIKHAATSAGELGTSDIAIDATSITMNSTNSEAKNTNVLISSALGCDIFKSGDITATTIGKSSSGNLSRSYTPTITKVLLFQSNQYYIKNGANGSIPALWRTSWKTGTTTPSTQELIEGIQDLQFEYGISTGTGENRAISDNAFVKADAVTNWDNVAAVKIRLLALGNEVNVSPEAQVYDREKGLICKKGGSACTSADSIDIPDRRLGQVFTAVVSLRNRLP
ncbi:PilW family protein [Pseudomonas sp. NCHU5208]|uniref:PilW family protein n=1 Tax=unclassified Pseudomonas TaxID=196821 RepID=UPI003F99541E